MTTRPPFRFGVFLTRIASAAAWRETARKIEALGYSTLFTPDHLGHMPPAWRHGATPPREWVDPIGALVAAASVTTTLRIGTFVLNAGMTHPAILARNVATADMLSDGRFELGIGTGHDALDQEPIGIPFEAPGTRVGRLEESIAILKGLWGPEPFSFEGRYWSVAAMRTIPKPVQRPHPPLLVGGGGKRLLTFAAREADIVNITAGVLREGEIKWETAEADILERLRWVREAAGERLDDLEINFSVHGQAITDDRAGAVDAIAKRTGLPEMTVARFPQFIIGSLDQIAEDLAERRDHYGISYYTLLAGSDEGIESFAPVVRRVAGT